MTVQLYDNNNNLTSEEVHTYLTHLLVETYGLNIDIDRREILNPYLNEYFYSIADAGLVFLCVSANMDRKLNYTIGSEKHSGHVLINEGIINKKENQKLEKVLKKLREALED